MMIRLAGCILFFSLFCNMAFGQARRVKPVTIPPKTPPKTQQKSTNLAIGGGITSSVLYLSRNVKENNDATGYHVSVISGGRRLFRTSFEYTWYRSIDIAPTWYRINAQTIEANLHVIARFQNSRSYFYPLFGVSYNLFEGYFTGVNDFLNLGALYNRNEEVSTQWLGLNAGLGYEFFIKRFSFFMEYKMRVGLMEGSHQLNIIDVCVSGGLRYNLRTRSINSLIRGTRSRYLLDTEEPAKPLRKRK